MSDFNIYTGPWTLEERGPIFGRILTLRSDRALILLSFVTLFVRFAGSRLWKIVAFFLHRIRSSAAPRDGLYHHQQVVLRNMESDSTALMGLLHIGWKWRQKAHSATRRSVGLSLVAAIHLGLLLTAALFVKNMATTSKDNVLISSVAEKCGWVMPPEDFFTQPNLKDVMLFGAWRTMTLRHLQNSADYVRACYRGRHVSAKTCAFYSKPSLNSRQSTAVCPFDAEICKGSEWVHFGSEFVESNRDLGINSKLEDRIRLRKSTACGVLDEKQFETVEQVTNPFPYRISSYNLGSTNFSEATFVTSELWQNFTWQAYKLFASSYFPASSISSFNPIDSLNVTGADLSIFFLENLATYHAEDVKDPWFHASTKQKSGAGTDVYTSEKTVSILACTETYEFCNQNLCTTPGGLFEAQRQVVDFPFVQSPQQKAVFDIMLNGSSVGAIANSASLLTDKVLLAQNFLWSMSGNDSTPLPKGHWVKEVENLHNISMASLQLNIVGHISPVTLVESTTVETGLQIVQGAAKEEKELCNMQMVRSDAHISFSVFGLSLILGVGFVVICLSFSIDKLVFWGARKAVVGTRRDVAKREWIVGDMLQLFRAAVEGRGVGPWTSYRKSVPVLLQPDVKFTFDGGRVGTWEGDATSTGYQAYHETRLLEAHEIK